MSPVEICRRGDKTGRFGASATEAALLSVQILWTDMIIDRTFVDCTVRLLRTNFHSICPTVHLLDLTNLKKLFRVLLLYLCAFLRFGRLLCLNLRRGAGSRTGTWCGLVRKYNGAVSIIRVAMHYDGLDAVLIFTLIER